VIVDAGEELSALARAVSEWVGISPSV